MTGPDQPRPDDREPEPPDDEPTAKTEGTEPDDTKAVAKSDTTDEAVTEGEPESDADDLAEESTDSTESGPRGPRHHPRLANVLIGVLCLLLGFALVIQVRTASSTEGLESARQEDLVSILDDLESGEDRMRDEITDLEDTRDLLASGGDQTQAALDEASSREDELSILAGTVPVQGPGIVLTISDPGGQLAPEVMLDVIQELRGAGAEAMQVGSVRIGVTSAFTGSAGAITVDGTALDPPYTVLAIGDPPTLTAALNIPGGVVATVDRAGGSATIEPADQIVVDAVRPVDPPEHAEPATPQD